jgi:histone H3/H4
MFLLGLLHCHSLFSHSILLFSFSFFFFFHISKHPGEGVTKVAKLLGQHWSSLSQEEKQIYQQKSSEEKERVAKQIEQYNRALEKAGITVDEEENNKDDRQTISRPFDLIIPVARVRKIAKLDTDVKNVSKEALSLITKCTELFVAKMGKETTKVARVQNRRTVLPQDVAHVCSHRDVFLFLKDDVQDLTKRQREEKQQQKGEHNGTATTATTTTTTTKSIDKNQLAAQNTKPLTAYFGTASSSSSSSSKK